MEERLINTLLDLIDVQQQKIAELQETIQMMDLQVADWQGSYNDIYAKYMRATGHRLNCDKCQWEKIEDPGYQEE